MTSIHFIITHDIQAVMLVVLHHKVRQLFEKDCHAPMVAARSVWHNYAKAHLFLRVDFVSKFVLLQKDQVNFYLGYLAQRQLKAVISAIQKRTSSSF